MPDVGQKRDNLNHDMERRPPYGGRLLRTVLRKKIQRLDLETANGTAVVGAGGIAMGADKGLVIKLVSKNKGVQLIVGPKGVDITMK